MEHTKMQTVSLRQVQMVVSGPDTSEHPHPLLTGNNGTTHCPHCNSDAAASTQPSP